MVTHVSLDFVDYRKDHRDLIIEVALASIQADHQPFLPFGYASNNRLPELPSWAVDFGIHPPETPCDPLLPASDVIQTGVAGIPYIEWRTSSFCEVRLS